MSTDLSFKHIFKFELKLLSLPDDNYFNNNRLWKMIFVLVCLTSVSLTVGSTIIVASSPDITTFANNMMYCSACWYSLCSACFIARFRHELLQVYTTITTHKIFFPISEDEVHFIADFSRKFNTLRLLATCGVSAAIVTACVITFESNQYLPMAVWYPFDISYPPFYLLAYVHQVIGLICSAYSSLAAIVITIGFTSFVTLQCKLIGSRTRNLSNGEKTLKDTIKMHLELLK